MVTALPHLAGFSYLFGEYYLKYLTILRSSVFCYFIHCTYDSFESKKTCSLFGPAQSILTPKEKQRIQAFHVEKHRIQFWSLPTYWLCDHEPMT